jgi:hypothetical protein
MNNVEAEIQNIIERNKKVEIDKAWEVSWVRRLFIALVTYAFAVSWLMVIHEPNLWLKAIVPVAGFILSTLSLPLIKRWWILKKM